MGRAFEWIIDNIAYLVLAVVIVSIFTVYFTNSSKEMNSITNSGLNQMKDSVSNMKLEELSRPAN